MDTKELANKGDELLGQGCFSEAESFFRRALKQAEHPSTRNNVAICQLHQGKYLDAFNTLGPSLKKADPNPVARAVAAQVMNA